MLTDLNDTHIIQIKKKTEEKNGKNKQKKKKEKKPTHSYCRNSSTNEENNRRKMQIPLTQIHDCLYHGETGGPGENHRPVASH